MDFKDKIIEALSLAETANDINLIRKRVSSTYSINRRTNEGRKLTNELLSMCSLRLQEMVDEGVNPF